MERSQRGEWTVITAGISPLLEAQEAPAAESADTWRRLPATSPGKESHVLKKAKSKATAILVGSAELYREIALSALSLVPRR